MGGQQGYSKINPSRIHSQNDLSYSKTQIHKMSPGKLVMRQILAYRTTFELKGLAATFHRQNPRFPSIPHFRGLSTSHKIFSN